METYTSQKEGLVIATIIFWNMAAMPNNSWTFDNKGLTLIGKVFHCR